MTSTSAQGPPVKMEPMKKINIWEELLSSVKKTFSSAEAHLLFLGNTPTRMHS